MNEEIASLLEELTSHAENNEPVNLDSDKLQMLVEYLVLLQDEVRSLENHILELGELE